MVQTVSQLQVLKYYNMPTVKEIQTPKESRPDSLTSRISVCLRHWLRRHPALKKIARSAYYLARNEPVIVAYDLSPEKIRELLDKPNPTIIEIGCHDGENTQWFVDQFQDPVIHCFEPDPRVIDKFSKRFSKITGVHLHPFALGNISGRMLFHQSSNSDPGSDWDASGSLMPPKNHFSEFPWVKFDSSIEVNVETLDSFCEKNSIVEVDLIWMDVQGAELGVIAGGRRTFEMARYLVTEYSNKELYEGQPNMKALLAALPEHRVVKRYPDDLLLVHR